MTAGEIATELRCSAATIRRLIRTGRLTALKVGPRTVRVPASEFRKFTGKSAGRAGADSGKG